MPPVPHIYREPEKKSPMGPVVGTAILVVLLLFGALYFWGQTLNARAEQAPLPLILGDPVT
ncbi:MAG TPA: hypothetical protein VJL39_03020 [Candidatus Paceibacterota bacterium]